MSEKRIFYVPEVSAQMELPQEEAGHCIRVLRLQEGDGIVIADGKGVFHDAVISCVAGKRCYVNIVASNPQPPLWKGRIRIGIAPTKLMERNEWFVEKAVEMGVDEIIFLLTDHSEREVIKLDRVERIAVAAMKQSQKATLPLMRGMVPFKQLMKENSTSDKFIAHCEPGQKVHLMDALASGGDSLVLIGPEGDFSVPEIQLALESGFRPVSLGESRLRTETAALAAVHMMGLANRI